MHLKSLLIFLLAGSSAGFAMQHPTSSVQKSSWLKMSGGADAPPPDLKVSNSAASGGIDGSFFGTTVTTGRVTIL